MRVIQGVPFHGPSDTTLLSKYGYLELDTETGLVTVTSIQPPRPPVMVPFSQVVFMTAMSADSCAVAPGRAAVAPVLPKVSPANDDRIVFVKDLRTGKIEEMSRTEAAFAAALEAEAEAVTEINEIADAVAE